MPAARARVPIALTIAGSDSGGGAGMQADLKTFAALGVHGTSVLTCLTAQNPRRVLSVTGTPPRMIRDQLEAVFAELRPDAMKTGMLYSAGILRSIVGFLEELRAGQRPRLVVDPVMVATSGARLLRPDAVRVLRERLLPLATLITPNLPEAEVLVGRPLRTAEDLRQAARELHGRHGAAALVKGGHLAGGRESLDLFYDGKTELLLTSPRVRGVHTHGTGCTLSAAITAWLARGAALPEAVARGKEFISHAIFLARRAGRHDVLDPLGAARPGERPR
jgi:hydroxymethylpyrimidine/phosphomethylpyrimidine kinase